MRRFRCAVMLCAVLCSCAGGPGPTAAEDDDYATPALLAARIDDLVRENEFLRGRMDELSGEIAVLKRGSGAILPPIYAREQTPVASQPAIPPPAGAASGKGGAQAAEYKEGSASGGDNKVSASLYGVVKADAIYNDSQLGILAQSAPPEPGGKNADEFKMTAKQTLVGVTLQGPAPGADGGRVSGKVEGDFYGATEDATSTSQFRIRQAYAVLDYPRWSVLAGQTWDVFSPLNPALLNMSPLWQAGNIGDRHPQAVLTRTFKGSSGETMIARVGILDSTAAEAQKRGAPLGEALISFERSIGGGPAYVAVGGMGGSSDVSGSDNRSVSLWAAALAAKYKPTGRVSLSVEAYQGAGLYKFRGGGSAGIERGKAVRTRGGWLQLSLQATPAAEFTVGAGMDDPYTQAQSASDSVWDDNASAFTNLKLKLAPALLWGIEYQYFLTHYKFKDDGAGNRVQSSLIYNF